MNGLKLASQALRSLDEADPSQKHWTRSYLRRKPYQMATPYTRPVSKSVKSVKSSKPTTIPYNVYRNGKGSYDYSHPSSGKVSSSSPSRQQTSYVPADPDILEESPEYFDLLSMYSPPMPPKEPYSQAKIDELARIQLGQDRAQYLLDNAPTLKAEAKFNRYQRHIQTLYPDPQDRIPRPPPIEYYKKPWLNTYKQNIQEWQDRRSKANQGELHWELPKKWNYHKLGEKAYFYEPHEFVPNLDNPFSILPKKGQTLTPTEKAYYLKPWTRQMKEHLRWKEKTNFNPATAAPDQLETEAYYSNYYDKYYKPMKYYKQKYGGKAKAPSKTISVASYKKNKR